MGAKLTGKVAVVTGGASGIGRACALAIAAEGAAVVIVDRDGASARSVADEIRAFGVGASAEVFDLVDVAGIAGLVERIAPQAQARIDILVNAAGVTDPDRTFLDVDLDAWCRVQAINSEAPFFMMQAVAKVMIAGQAGGRIVNITSASAFRAAMSFPAYGPSKAALTHSTRLAAADYWDLNDGTRAWSKRFADRMNSRPPTSLQAGVYGGSFHYLKAIGSARSTNPAVCMAKMKAMPTDDPLFGKGSVREDGRVLHNMYLFEVKRPEEVRGGWDLYKLTETISGEEAFRPMSEGGCYFVTTK